jgi:hypothetical protein
MKIDRAVTILKVMLFGVSVIAFPLLVITTTGHAFPLLSLFWTKWLAVCFAAAVYISTMGIGILSYFTAPDARHHGLVR